METAKKSHKKLWITLTAIVVVLGSSVTYGAASLQNSLGEYFQQRFGMELTKEAVSGTTTSTRPKPAAANGGARRWKNSSSLTTTPLKNKCRKRLLFDSPCVNIILAVEQH